MPTSINTSLKQVVTLWIIYVVVCSVHGKLVINAEHFSFPEFLLFKLFFLELLEFQMATEAFDDDDILVVVLDAGIGLGVEGALVELFHLPLPPLHRNLLMLLFKFGSYFVLIDSRIAVVTDHTGDTFVQLRSLRVGLGLERVLVVLLLLVLLLAHQELVLGRDAYFRAILVAVLLHDGFRSLIDVRLEGEVTIHFLLLKLSDDFFALGVLKVKPVKLVVLFLDASLRVTFHDDGRGQINLGLERALGLGAVLVGDLLLLLNLLLQELILPLVKTLQISLEHLIALSQGFTRLRDIRSMPRRASLRATSLSLSKEIALQPICGIFVKPLIYRHFLVV